MKIKKISVKGYEEVAYGEDLKSGLRAFIAIHSTRLGPSLGGIRMIPFRSEKEALEDVLRLAKAMSYKAAVSGLRLGGGKAVIIGDPQKEKSEALFRAMGRFIDVFQGRYLAAEDSGILPLDLDIVLEETPYVTGTHERFGGSGDPSPSTALGILKGIKTCLLESTGSTSLRGNKVALQGLGQVGYHLAKLLHQEKAVIAASDVDPEKIKRARKSFPFKETAPEKIYEAEADIFSPCAFGGILNERTIPQLKAKIVAGGANNQLKEGIKTARMLEHSGILYAPDYVVNAGGLIHLYVYEVVKEKDLEARLSIIPGNLARIFSASRKDKITTEEAATRLAEERLNVNVRE